MLCSRSSTCSKRYVCKSDNSSCLNVKLLEMFSNVPAFRAAAFDSLPQEIAVAVCNSTLDAAAAVDAERGSFLIASFIPRLDAYNAGRTPVRNDAGTLAAKNAGASNSPPIEDSCLY